MTRNAPYETHNHEFVSSSTNTCPIRRAVAYILCDSSYRQHIRERPEYPVVYNTNEDIWTEDAWEDVANVSRRKEESHPILLLVQWVLIVLAFFASKYTQSDDIMVNQL